MGDISEHFSRDEFACPHCGQSVIAPGLIDALEELRALAPSAIRITSGYRCPEHNKSVGGASGSQHQNGVGVDIAIADLTVEQMYVLAEQVDGFRNGGLGVYDDGHLHIDVRGRRARWFKAKGKTVSVKDFFSPVKSPHGSG